MPDDRDAVITGIGLVSCLGEGMDAHWAALDSGAPPPIDAGRFAPYAVHPLVRLELDRQIPKKGDQRQMEPWQRTGTYAAGLALSAAGVAGDAALLARTDMIVAATGGERDTATDGAILSALPRAAQPGAFLNERLQSDLRPTLFLAQLSNLLAGNISIVHGVVGSSRSLLGEESAGADALRLAQARIAAGQSDLALVGAACNAERADLLLDYAMGGYLWQASEPGAQLPGVWARQAQGGGLAPGSAGAFLVIESRAHAAARGASPIARIDAVAVDRCRRAPGEASANAARQWAALRGRIDPAATAVISAATGAAAATAEEAAFLAGLGLPVRGVVSQVGYSVEANAILATALAVVALRQGRLFAPLDPAETPMTTPLAQAIVIAWGHWRGEAMLLLGRETG
jgi:3-oxoacyl-[acyl-carrier-protein] synthase II